MKCWPDLVLPQFCKVFIKVQLESEELNEDGGPLNVVNWKGFCNYQEQTKRIYTSDKSYITVNASCMIPNDIAPSFSTGSGYINVFDQRREIASFQKVRNPDGSVNFTRIDLK